MRGAAQVTRARSETRIENNIAGGDTKPLITNGLMTTHMAIMALIMGGTPAPATEARRAP